MARGHRTRRVSFRKRLRKYTAKESGERGENVSKRTPSDPMMPSLCMVTFGTYR